MGLLPNTPSWGVLVKAPLNQARELLSELANGADFRTSGSWTAAFYMKPADTSDDRAAVLLYAHGYSPVYHFDFSKHQFSVSVWDVDRKGELLTDNGVFVDPDTILRGVGVRAPYWDEPSPSVRPVEVREATIVEGLGVEQLRALVGDGPRVDAGPVGAIVYAPNTKTRFSLWDHAPDRVFEIMFYPETNTFRYRVMKGDECLGTFAPNQQTSDGTPRLLDVNGKSDPAEIVEQLGLDRSFVDSSAARAK